MLYDSFLSRSTTNSAAARVTIKHTQLRDLVICPTERGIVNYVCGKFLVSHDITEQGSAKAIAQLDFEPTCIASGCGVIVAGGQRSEIFVGPLQNHSSNNAMSWSTTTNLVRSAETSINNHLLITTGSLTPALSINPASISSVEPRLFVSNNDLHVQVFTIATRASMPPGGKRLQPSGNLRLSTPINHTSLSPDGRTLVAVGDDNKVFLYNVNGGDLVTFDPITTYKAGTDASFSTAWSGDGRKFAVACQDGQITTWDVRSSKPLAVFRTSETVTAPPVPSAGPFHPRLLLPTNNPGQSHYPGLGTLRDDPLVHIPPHAHSSLRSIPSSSDNSRSRIHSAPDVQRIHRSSRPLSDWDPTNLQGDDAITVAGQAIRTAGDERLRNSAVSGQSNRTPADVQDDQQNYDASRAIPTRRSPLSQVHIAPSALQARVPSQESDGLELGWDLGSEPSAAGIQSATRDIDSMWFTETIFTRGDPGRGIGSMPLILPEHGPGWGQVAKYTPSRVVKFSPCGGDREVMVFTEEIAKFHVVDAQTFNNHAIISTPNRRRFLSGTKHTLEPRSRIDEAGDSRELSNDVFRSPPNLMERDDSQLWGQPASNSLPPADVQHIAGMSFDPSGSWVYVGTEAGIFEWEVEGRTRTGVRIIDNKISPPDLPGVTWRICSTMVIHYQIPARLAM